MLLLSLGLWPLPHAATGQQPSTVSAELAEALTRTATGERIPVLIQVDLQDGPRPLAVRREFRAAEQASNLAGLYSTSAARLRAELPADLAVDLDAGRVLWIGGAIAAELTAAQVQMLESQPGVQRLHYDGLVEVGLAARPTESGLLWSPGLPVAQDPGGGLPWGLEAVGAPELWARGATGDGTVVAIIDSGVDGNHPLLWRKWRGLSGAASEAWFDPWGLTETPVDDDNTGGVGHGTLVATVAVGSLEPGDTLIRFGQPQVVVDELEVVTGVAPGAEWVAANAFEIFGGVTYTRRSVLLQAMQWVLDPDGDPATVSDIPDVVNNSWGYPPGGCDGLFDRAIDALEAGGVPVVFAAGNRSAGFETVASPAERADLLLNAFAVGAAVREDGRIVVAENSLGGPTPCAPGAVKPEVVAPGDVPVVRNGGPHTAVVAGRSGAFTSWAAPHAVGALALLSGLNPFASANDLKAALFSTATDLDPPGLDNRSGAGFIDLVAAAQRIGGLGAVDIVLAGWSWDSTNASLTLDLQNRGSGAFPGGSAELRHRPSGVLLASAPAPAIPPRRRSEMTFAGLGAELVPGARLSLRLESDGAVLELPLSLSAASATAVVLADGAVRFSLDGRGRLGRVAGTPGFEFLGGDWLIGGAFLFGDGEHVSDAAYVDVLQRPGLKSNPVGSDTDWRDIEVISLGRSAEIAFSDDRALLPLGATVEQTTDLVALGDSGAFVALKATVELRARRNVPLAGVLLDWDLAGRDTVYWDPALRASVMTAADSSGPWVALATTPGPPTTHAAVPLGTPLGGFYVVGPDAGVLAKPEGFGDGEKALYMRLGGPPTSESEITDWAQLVTVGPLRGGESTTFLIAAGESPSALAAALDSARAFAGGTGSAAAAARSFELLPAYPNPFDPTAGDAINLPFLVDRSSEPVQAVLDIYTIAGQLIYSERRTLEPDAPIEPFRWSGTLADGGAAASGVYGYIIRVGDAKKYAKFVLLK